PKRHNLARASRARGSFPTAIIVRLSCRAAMSPSGTHLRSRDVQSEIDALLLSGRATTMAEAEEAFLDAHLDDIAQLVIALPDDEFAQHDAVKMLMSHGSRPWEDSL